MIKNEWQYKIIRAKADEVRIEIADLERAEPAEVVSVEMRAKPLDALRKLLGDIEAEPTKCDALHDSSLIEASGIGEFPLALIRARIARGSTWRPSWLNRPSAKLVLGFLLGRRLDRRVEAAQAACDESRQRVDQDRSEGRPFFGGRVEVVEEDAVGQ